MARALKNQNKKKCGELKNGLAKLAEGVIRDVAPAQEIAPMFYNTRNYLISYNVPLLSNLYVENGLVQTMIDQPVEDALRGKVKISSKDLEAEDIEKIQAELESLTIQNTIKDAFKWTRLFGGGGIIVNVIGQDPSTPLNIEEISEGAKVEFYACDRWELSNSPQGSEAQKLIDGSLQEDIYYYFYGKAIHPSRVLVLKGKTAPALKRMQLAGWGMSELERLVTPLNKFNKNQNVIYELLDESKVDVYSLENYNGSLLAGQEEAIRQRIEFSNVMKNYLNALILDREDSFEQKSVNFAGVTDLLVQARLDIASAVKMPVTKLFGMSSAGFNSGDDDLENYNSMIEREVRAPARDVIKTILKILSIANLGILPENIDIEFPSLRVASEGEIQEIKDREFSRGKQLYELGLMTKGEFYAFLLENNIINQSLQIQDNDDYREESEFQPQTSLKVTDEISRIV